MIRVFKYGFLLIGATVLIGFLLMGKITHEKFDSEKWKNWEENEATSSMRWDMMNSLRNTYELKGKSKTEIIQLLGKPKFENKTSFRYYLGMSKRGINTGSLKIKFNEEGIVTNFLVWQG